MSWEKKRKHTTSNVNFFLPSGVRAHPNSNKKVLSPEQVTQFHIGILDCIKEQSRVTLQFVKGLSSFENNYVFVH